MRKAILAVAISSLITAAQSASPTSAPASPTAATGPSHGLTEARDRYLRMGYGMFIHFSLSTYTHAEVRGEKIFKLEHETGKESPASFNPPSGTVDVESWAKLAKDAGMRYGILTTKHIGGFCLWDSQHTTHDVGASPYKKDVVRQFVNAFRKQGLRVGFYYCPADRNRPRDPKYTHAQIEELLTNYGPVDAMWLDQFGWPKEIPRDDVRALVHRLQPTCLFDTNGGARPELGDVVNIERVGAVKEKVEPFDPSRNWFPKGPPAGAAVEICESMRNDGAWFHKVYDNDKLRPDDYILNTLQRQAQAGGSYLLSVTPDKDGRIPKEQSDQLLRLAPAARTLLEGRR